MLALARAKNQGELKPHANLDIMADASLCKQTTITIRPE